ncbi:MAG: rhomboid family intramembrane serine protease [Acidimicrobiia bacterium]|nr:rhomboid family intramembrane serine protease [Acidimicrobiia bacterium]
MRTGRAAFAPADPIATKVLIGVNLVIFMALIGTSLDPAQALSGAISGPVFERFAVLGGPLLYDDGGLAGVAFGEPWRLATGAFLHAGLVHLGFNMLLLWLLGSQLEQVLGRARFVALYFASLFAGSLGVMLLDPGRPTVGASGAVFGLMAAAFLLQRSRGLDPWRSGIGGLILLNLGFTFLWPGISVGGHLGGLVGGALATTLILRLEQRAAGVVPAVAVCVVLAATWIGVSLWAADQHAASVLPGVLR